MSDKVFIFSFAESGITIVISLSDSGDDFRKDNILHFCAFNLADKKCMVALS